MKMTKAEYGEYVQKMSPNSPFLPNLLRAFLVGGVICSVGQGIMQLYSALQMEETTLRVATSMTLVFLGVLLTGLGVYDKIARFGGAGTLVPITGFANAVSAPAIEFKAEGFILGVGTRMFTIAGPVIVYGVAASVLYGFFYWLLQIL